MSRVNENHVSNVELSDVSSSNLISRLFFAVIGLGSAGHSRLEAILSDEAEERGFELSGIVSRRSQTDYESIDQFSLEEVERGDHTDAVVISTESANHAQLVRRFLKAKKHVLVEYPLALSVAEAESLYALAEEKGVTLYVSQIELLSTQFKSLKAELASMGPLQVGLLYMARSLGDMDSMGFLSFQGISRLSWLVHLFGPLTVTSAQLEYDSDDGTHLRLIVRLATSEGSEITWIEEQSDSLTPRKQVVFKMQYGNVLKLPEWRYEDWWLHDLKLFARRVEAARDFADARDYARDYVAAAADAAEAIADAESHKGHVLTILRIAEEVEECCSAVEV